MISVSFYLLTPDAASQSLVYASISNKVNRLRFSTGESFIASYCNVRKKKGGKDLVRKNTTFYFEYSSKLNEIRDSLIRIEMDLGKSGTGFTLEQIKEAYYLQIGKTAPPPKVTFDVAFQSFVRDNLALWSTGTQTKVNSTLMHLKEFEKLRGEITPETLTEELWNDLRNNYFTAKKEFSNSTSNKYLSIFKQFLKYAKKKQIIRQDFDLEDLKYSDEIEPFKIALKEEEVEVLFNLDLSGDLRLDRVRDLFGLEILTGQRFSDIPKVLDKRHMSDTNIQIYQQKTGEKVSIPLHPKLKKHINHIFDKYPEGLPIISNQKFNEYLKEICKEAKFNNQHSWVTLSGKRKISQSDFRYNLITSHTGRRTFCTLALKAEINSEMIMKVTGHKKYDQFREYVKVDDADLDKAFEGMFKVEKKEGKRKAKEILKAKVNSGSI